MAATRPQQRTMGGARVSVTDSAPGPRLWYAPSLRKTRASRFCQPTALRHGRDKHEAMTVTTMLDPQNAGSTRPDGEGGAGNLDKVRDLLFGGQMRDYDRRFSVLARRIWPLWPSVNTL